MLPKVNYVNNVDLLSEIHKSKCSYSSFTRPEYSQHDVIISDISEITEEVINSAINAHARRLTLKELDFRKKESPDTKIKLAECEYDKSLIQKTDLIFRLMTYDHIPTNDTRKKNQKTISDSRERVNFPPFQHWKYDDKDNLICVGKSHWKGDLDTGEFSITHGNITNKLANMYMKMCDRYSTRGNVRSYCVDEETEALTQRGWLGIDDITEDDIIMSYNDGNMAWSTMSSIYKGEYEGLMHKMTCTGLDALITPEHKKLTARGLIKAELLKETDRLILMGDSLKDSPSVELKYSDDFVELMGWIVTEGCYDIRKKSGKFRGISIHQNEGEYAERIRGCLNNLGYSFSEYMHKSNIRFKLTMESAWKIYNRFPIKNFDMEFLLDLSESQRLLLLNTMIDGDGWRHKTYMRYCQKDRHHVDLFQALCAMCGVRAPYKLKNIVSYGKPTTIHILNLYSTRHNISRVENIDFHGGKRSGREHPGRGKEEHPNVPTTYYKGRVWCPSTEFGSFLVRRNGQVFLTGNSYVDEMRNQSLLQLVKIGLQFDESKSDNPFSYFSTVIGNGFCRVINVEKRNQVIRDELLEMHGLSPSFSRTSDYEHEHAMQREHTYQSESHHE